MKKTSKVILALIFVLGSIGLLNAENLNAATQYIGKNDGVIVYGQLEFRDYSGLHAQSKTYIVDDEIVERIHSSVAIYENGDQQGYTRSSTEYDWYDSDWAYSPSITKYGGREYSAISYHSATINGTTVTGSMKITK